MATKILLVDDDEDLKYIVRAALQADGFEVMTAANGEHALKLLSTQVPDLMVVDLTMPVMNGWNFSMKVRLDERFKKTPIIITSSLLEREATPDKSEVGTYYIPKPFDLFNLIAKIKELLQQS